MIDGAEQTALLEWTNSIGTVQIAKTYYQPKKTDHMKVQTVFYPQINWIFSF